MELEIVTQFEKNNATINRLYFINIVIHLNRLNQYFFITNSRKGINMFYICDLYKARD